MYTARVSAQQHPASRYSIGGSETEYMDAEQKVLKHKKDITSLKTLQVEGEKCVSPEPTNCFWNL